ncbi:hypothetical protein [Clostridium sp.]|uniref:hypothetical protein n=1 Tax=Clostridium sp. TaxID=1506 RepID=UPI002FC8AB01
MRKDVFTTVLKKIGMSESDMMNFHAKFEETNSKEHRAFLEFLGLSNDQIEKVIKNTTI